MLSECVSWRCKGETMWWWVPWLAWGFWASMHTPSTLWSRRNSSTNWSSSSWCCSPFFLYLCLLLLLVFLILILFIIFFLLLQLNFILLVLLLLLHPPSSPAKVCQRTGLLSVGGRSTCSSWCSMDDFHTLGVTLIHLALFSSLSNYVWKTCQCEFITDTHLAGRSWGLISLLGTYDSWQPSWIKLNFCSWHMFQKEHWLVVDASQTVHIHSS